MEQERYEIIKLLGKGRTGGVYEAEDTVLGRRVAMRRFFDIEGDADHSTWEESFVAIAQNLCALQHPGIATVFDAGVDEDGAYIVSQLLNGQPLNERLKEGAINEWDVYQTTEGILDALSVAHEAGFIHGAFNPSSIIRVPRASGGYRNIIVDLGLSRLAPLIQGERSSLALMAEPTMMAPEQFDGSPATVVSDLYMVGQFAYICLVGGHPFAGKSMDEAAVAHASEQLRPLHSYEGQDISKEFSDWVHSLIEKNPADRPQTIPEALASMPKLVKPIDYEQRKKKGSSIATPGAIANGPATTLTEGNRGATATNRLKAATPNVGTAAQPARATTTVNTARATTAAQGNMLGARPAPATAGSLQGQGLSTAKKSSKLPVILGGVGGVLILVVAAVVMFGGGEEDKKKPSRPNNKPTVPQLDLNLSSDGNADLPPIDNPDQPTSTDNQDSEEPKKITASFSTPKFENKFRNTVENARLIKISSNAKDFLIPAENKIGDFKLKKTNKYFRDLKFHGDCSSVELDAYTIKFSRPGTKTTFVPKFHTNNLEGDLNTGEGYMISGVVPDDHSGPLSFKVFFSTWNCVVHWEANITSKFKGIIPKPFKGANGAYSMDIDLDGVSPGDTFRLFMKAAAVVDDKDTMALVFNGVWVNP